jgi:hypothetical protein
MKLGECIEKLVVFTKREKIKHLGQCILHVQTRLLISQCKCLPQPHIATWPSKNEMDVFNEASRTYSRAMYLLKQVKSKPAQYNGNLNEVSVVWLPFLLHMWDVWSSNLSMENTHPDNFYGLCQCIQLNSRILPQISPLALTSLSISIN